MSTESTTALEAQLRTRLLTFAPLGGESTVADEIGSTETGSGADGKLYWDRAPDNIDATSPIRWGVLRLKNRRSDMENAEREVVEL